MLLEGKIVVVSGAGPGLGRQIVVSSARQGATVVLAARTRARLDEIVAEVEAIGGTALGVEVDVADDEQCAALIGTTVERFGRVDVLVNNAFQQPPFEMLADQDLEVIRQSFEVNLFAALRLTKLVTPIMAEQRRGSIVMVNSAILRHTRPAFGAYKMAKHALLGLARNLAEELGPLGIRVNSVAPGYIWGDAVRQFLEVTAAQRGVPYEQVHDEITATHALRFIPDAEAIAEGVIFLASDMARAITGQCLDVNAGEYCH